MQSTLVPLFGPIPGGIEMVVILLIAILLFGANKIPKLARSTGQSIGEFKKGRQQVEQELEEMDTEPTPEDGAVSETESEPDAAGEGRTESEADEPSN